MSYHRDTTSAQTQIVSDGVALPMQQQDTSVPSTYSSIPNFGPGNIGDVMGHLASYISFLEYQTSLAETDYSSWSQYYDFEKKKILLTLESERKDIMDAKADQQLEELLGTLREKYAKMKLMKSLLEGKKRVFDSLSRELSRRALVQRMESAGV